MEKNKSTVVKIDTSVSARRFVKAIMRALLKKGGDRVLQFSPPLSKQEQKILLTALHALCDKMYTLHFAGDDLRVEKVD